MSTLMLHRGGQQVTQKELLEVNTPLPTRTWMPLAHDTFLSTVKREMTHSGLQIENETLALSQSRDGNYGDRFFGLLQIKQNNGADYAFMIGVRNSHDCTFPAALCVGSKAFICDNLAFSAEVVLARKHTCHIVRDLPRLINAAVGKLGDLRVTQKRRIAAYNDTEITDVEFHDLSVRAMDAGVLAASKVPKVLEEYRNPRYEAFTPRTVWSGFNAFTEVLKSYNLQDLPRRTQTLHGLCDLLARLN